ncbi:MAG: PilZ domain-containing protein [Planctomycetes bacterium]|nr:PilZ domain-containing protein [Planctomycetota bacterium]
MTPATGKTQPHIEAELVKIAAATRRQVSLAVPTGNQWRMCSSEMLDCDMAARTVLLSYPDPVWGEDAVDLPVGCEVGVRFPARERRVMFMARMAEVLYIKVKDNRLPVISLKIVSDIMTVNQREHYRVRIPDDVPLKASLWKPTMKGRTDPAETPPVHTARVTDLSVGGLGVTDLSEADQACWKVSDHVGVCLDLADAEALLLIAEIRRISRLPLQPTSYGLAFISAETVRKTFHAQELLAQMVTHYQRMHLQNRVETG